jgi:hypothetical protein
LVETTDTALQRLLAISSAVPPSPLPVAVIGAGDALFAALYLSAAVRHGLAYRRVALALGAGLLAAGALTFVFHRALPALPFLGAAVLAVEPRARRVARRDRGPTLVAAAILLGAVLRVVLR